MSDVGCKGCEFLNALGGCEAYDHCVRQAASTAPDPAPAGHGPNRQMSIEELRELARHRRWLRELQKVHHEAGNSSSRQSRKHSPSKARTRSTARKTKPRSKGKRAASESRMSGSQSSVTRQPARTAAPPSAIALQCECTSEGLVLAQDCGALHARAGEAVVAGSRSLRRGVSYRVMVSRSPSGQLVASGLPIRLS